MAFGNSFAPGAGGLFGHMPPQRLPIQRRNPGSSDAPQAAPGNGVHLPGAITQPYQPSQPQVPGQPVQSLPQGTPLQPGNVAATAPLPYQQFGSIASVNPAMLDPASYYAQYGQYVSQGMQPYFQQQQQQLNADLRARGIQDSGAAGYLEGNLLGQQGAQVEQGALRYGTEGALSNQQAANQAAYFNAGQYANATQQNFDAYNNYLQQLLGLGGGELGGLQSAYLNSFGPNTGVQSGFGSVLSGTGKTYGDVYSGAQQAQAQQMQMAMMALGAGG